MDYLLRLDLNLRAAAITCTSLTIIIHFNLFYSTLYYYFYILITIIIHYNVFHSTLYY